MPGLRHHINDIKDVERASRSKILGPIGDGTHGHHELMLVRYLGDLEGHDFQRSHEFVLR